MKLLKRKRRKAASPFRTFLPNSVYVQIYRDPSAINAEDEFLTVSESAQDALNHDLGERTAGKFVGVYVLDRVVALEQDEPAIRESEISDPE